MRTSEFLAWGISKGFSLWLFLAHDEMCQTYFPFTSLLAVYLSRTIHFLFTFESSAGRLLSSKWTVNYCCLESKEMLTTTVLKSLYHFLLHILNSWSLVIVIVIICCDVVHDCAVGALQKVPSHGFVLII